MKAVTKDEDSLIKTKLKDLSKDLRSVNSQLRDKKSLIKSTKEDIKKLTKRKQSILNDFEELAKTPIDTNIAFYIEGVLDEGDAPPEPEHIDISILDNDLEELSSNINSSLDKLRGILGQLK